MTLPDSGGRDGSLLAVAARGAGFGELKGHRQDNANTGLEQLAQDAAGAGREVLVAALETAEGQTFFSFLFGNSPHLARLLLRDLEFSESLLTETPDWLRSDVLQQLVDLDPGAVSEEQLMRLLRNQRGRVAVLAAVLDCFGIADVMNCARLLSDMADHAVRLTVQHLLLERVRRGELVLEPERGCWGYFVLAMGKHGARELNYSSDIDLIALYDPERMEYTGPRSLEDCLQRLTQRLVHILQTRTGDGYVFRTDLRLRPDAASTPVAISTGFALDYYQRLGRTWERAAMIKARPVAGDLDAGEDFLGKLAPFIWERELDFNSVEDLRSMSQQIHDFHGHGAVRIAGHDVKLGRGGIREVEFFVHMHQLAFGGRNPRLRGAGVLPLLDLLQAEHHLLPREASDLQQAYLLLRRVEHRLQMVNDDQTQTLPNSEEGLEHIARFLGMASSRQLQAEVGAATERIHALYTARFNVPESERDITVAVLDGPGGSPDARSLLAAAGFSRTRLALATLRGWAEGRHDSLSSVAARATVRDILHEIIAAVGRTPEPDRTLARMDLFFKVLPADLSFLAMIRANTWLLNLIAVVMGSAPRIADTLGSNPRILQAVVQPLFFLPIATADELKAELRERLQGSDGDSQQRIDTVLAWVEERRFQVGVQALEDLITVKESSSALGNVAEVAITSLLEIIGAELERAHGPMPPDTRFAVLALDKFGADELTFGSALKLALLADLPAATAMTDGPNPIAVEEYLGRLARQLVAALRGPGAAGSLYEVTVWQPLRAEGGQETPVTSVASFREYYAAETTPGGELFALGRTRILWGDPPWVATLEAEIHSLLTRPRDPQGLRRQIASLRQQLAARNPQRDPFSVTQVRGGLLDLHFIARYLQLLHAHQFPKLRTTATPALFKALRKAGVLPKEEAQLLRGALHLQRSLQALLRLTWGSDRPVTEAPAALHAKLARALQQEGLEALEKSLRQTQGEVYEIFQRHIGEPESGSAGE